MRRLSALLIIATLLVALVPSATMAGKAPPPEIGGVMVKGAGGTAPDCTLNFWASFAGRAYAVRFSRYVGPTIQSSFTVTIPRKADAVGTETSVSALAAQQSTWKVALVNRKGAVQGTEVETTPEWWVKLNSCPLGTNGTLAGFPTYLYPTPTFQGTCVASGGTYSASYQYDPYMTLTPGCLWSEISETDWLSVKAVLVQFCTTNYSWPGDLGYALTSDPVIFGCTNDS